jgi:beta-glucanase (GH16 family)
MTRKLRFALCAALLAACAGDDDSGATAADGGGQQAQSSGGSAAPSSGGRSGGSGGASANAGSGGSGGKNGSGGAAAVRDAGARDASAMHDAAAERDASAPHDFDPGSEWTLAWHDEFDGAEGTQPDAARWVFETGGNGFGNNELEFYTDRKENAALDGHGMLVITARKESYMGRDYTSARLKTQGKFEHTYGRYEARIRIPKGQGIWPAFWMLGNDIGSASWPACGEIDIMENIGKEPTTVHGTIHGPGYSGGGGLGVPSMLPGNAPFADDFHLYAIEWTEDAVRWFVDDTMYGMKQKSDLPNGAKWVYDHPFFLLLNVAVGGQWPGEPNDTTQFPQTMTIDFVRVYDRAP